MTVLNRFKGAGGTSPGRDGSSAQTNTRTRTSSGLPETGRQGKRVKLVQATLFYSPTSRTDTLAAKKIFNDRQLHCSVADPDRFGPDPTSEIRPDPDKTGSGSGFI
jgi:hypothetical protein